MAQAEKRSRGVLPFIKSAMIVLCFKGPMWLTNAGMFEHHRDKKSLLVKQISFENDSTDRIVPNRSALANLLSMECNEYALD